MSCPEKDALSHREVPQNSIVVVEKNHKAIWEIKLDETLRQTMVNTVVEVKAPQNPKTNSDTVKEIKAPIIQEEKKQPIAEFDQFIKEQKAYC